VGFVYDFYETPFLSFYPSLSGLVMPPKLHPMLHFQLLHQMHSWVPSFNRHLPTMFQPPLCSMSLSLRHLHPVLSRFQSLNYNLLTVLLSPLLPMSSVFKHLHLMRNRLQVGRNIVVLSLLYFPLCKVSLKCRKL
jgi:hypothetical protein